jgi:hypothetical protein
MTKRSCAFVALCGLFALGACANNDRDENGTGEGPGTGDDGGDDGADDGADDGGDDGGDAGPDVGDDGTGDDGGDDGTGDDGTDTGDDGGAGTAPDCRAMWVGQYIPATEYMHMKDPETAEEMFCYVNMERINYQFHGRNSGCIWSGGTGDDTLSWPYEMEWDAGLVQAATEEAEAVADGASPAGVFDYTLWVDGCATEEYTVTDPDDLLSDWEQGNGGLSKSNGTARMGVHYYDPGPDAPTLTKLGVGLAVRGQVRTWVVKFGM